MGDSTETETEIKSDPPTRSGGRFVEKLKAYRDIILAVAALATAVGSWFRPTDTTATKNSFDWTAQQIEKLSAEDMKTQQDLIALHNYLEGYVVGQTRHESGQSESAQPSEAGSRSRRSNNTRRPRVGAVGAVGAVTGMGAPIPAAAVAPSIAFDVTPNVALDAAPAAIAAPEAAVAVAPSFEAAPEPSMMLPVPRPVSEQIRKPRFEDVSVRKY